MNQIITINGPMASGKSTLSAELNKRLKDYVFVDRAYIKDIMLRKVRDNDKKIAKQLSKEAAHVLIRGLMQNRKNIIVQELMPSSIMKHHAKELKKYKYRIKPVFLECSLKEALRRDIHRPRILKGKRPEVVIRMHERYTGPEEGLLINTEKSSLRSTIRQVIDFVKQ